MMQQDWHPADIIAGLRKRGTSLSAVPRKAGLASSTLANALTRRWPKDERLIAEALGVAPEQIWPSRYLRSR
ncbi:transcriptional regulator [Salmonella enterica]|nr:transcriptional regulator [Salmonella enterica]